MTSKVEETMVVEQDPVLAPDKLTLGEFVKTPSEDHFVTLTHGKTYYETHGDPSVQTKGWIVCLHGLSWASWSYHFITPYLLKEGFCVLTFDFYGRGHSDGPNVEYTPQLLVDQLVELLEKLKITNKFTLVGFSMGGCVATLYSQKFPDRLQRLVLIGPAIVPVQSNLVARLLTWPLIGTILYYTVVKKAMLQRLRTQPFADDFKWPERIPTLIKEMVERVEYVLTTKPNGTYAIYSTLCNFPFQKGCVEALDKVVEKEIPMLLMWGKYDHLCPFAEHELVTKQVPNAEFVAIDSAHATLFENPIECIDALLNFLQKTPKAKL